MYEAIGGTESASIWKSLVGYQELIMFSYAEVLLMYRSLIGCFLDTWCMPLWSNAERNQSEF
jgi:hypothetical protein